jgi:outer membrane lipoprotein carrier protein
MRKKMKRTSFSFILLVFLFLPGLIHSEQSPDSASEKLALGIEEKYNSLKTLYASFEQETKSPDFSTTRKFKGKMYLKNPNKFRIELSTQTVVSDGKYVWVYSQENQQVTKNLVEKSNKFFRPNDYLFDFRENYNYKLEGEEKIGKFTCYKMVYTSKNKDEFFEKIIVFFEKENLLARRIEYLDQNDNYTTLSFQDIKVDLKLSDSKFVFEPPKGVELVDLTELGDNK